MPALSRPGKVAAVPFRDSLEQYSSRIAALLGLRWRRAGPQDHGKVIWAAGERIVTFARPGKSPENEFLRPIERVPRPEDAPASLADRNGF